MTNPAHPRRRTVLASAFGAGVLASCGKQTDSTNADGDQNGAERDVAATGSTGTEPESELTTQPAPVMPHGGSYANGAPAGAGVLTYDLSADRDWSDIDRWYRSKGLHRHAWNGEPRGHRIVAGARGTGEQVDQDTVLASGMMLENDTGFGAGVIVIAHHNVTRLFSGAVRIGDTVYDEPLMGIHAPEVAGDVFTWYVPVDGGSAQHTFVATDVEIIPDADGEYAKLFAPRPDGIAQLVTYQCHPCGSLRERRVVRHKWTKSSFTSTPVTYV